MSRDNPTVMVVEDEVLLLQAITKKLKLSNIDVLSCSSGQQAIDYLDNLDELPDAVWLDYYLKDMNGLAFMQALKANPKWANIPVLVVSNSASPQKVHTMLGLGAKQYILKAEHRLDEIIDMIRDFIQSSAPSPEEAAAGPAPASPTATPPADAQAPPSSSTSPSPQGAPQPPGAGLEPPAPVAPSPPPTPPQSPTNNGSDSSNSSSPL